MMIDDDLDAEIYYSLNYKAKIVRVIDTMLIPCSISIRADLSSDDDVSSHKMTAALFKIKYWVDAILENAVAFSADNFEAYGMFYDEEGAARTSNNIMLTPGEPTDDLLAALIQAKFEALADGAADFNLCELRSDNALGLRVTFAGNAADFLPTLEQWVGPRSFFDQPWWNRDDISMYDIEPPPGADLSKKPAWAAPINARIFAGLGEAEAPTQGQQGPGIVIRPQFKPKVIDGGKKPDA